ncbi:insulin-like peptide receptor [Caerostris darwini]|uniref:Tyrosine-protein kinase receptor n=1 Tax=Caerostris darwini TaxID=1538125 RepID=A0AAV4X6N3_9ARAC|nr:insulin-like peptide receptor [Caerostris darwini]
MGRGPFPPLVALVLLCLCCGVTQKSERVEKVCKSVDIRNKVENFKKLENCTVIEGHLQILLIDNGQAQDYDGLSFPDLVEITDYLLLYRAFGLNSVGKLFPNLSVIRGNELFHNYGFVVFEMYHLQEIGLSKLTDILRGSVRIEKNPGLCYVETIDWDLIAKEGKGGHFIKANKKPSECPNTCPENDQCPESREKSHRLCWNSQHCQKVCCKTDCEHNATCYNSTHCCHPECLGGCYGPLSSDCIACKHVMYYDEKYGKRCMKKCPSNLYEFMGRRCVQEDECKNYTITDKQSEDSLGGKRSEDAKVYFKPFKNKCLQECPLGYVVDDNNPHLCKRCDAKCPKICPGMTVDHVGAAQNYRGCTRINGSLEIHIQGGSNVIKELEENMNMIEQIDGYLKIARSFPLVSLNFLKSLTTIRGEQLDKKNYALLVLDNQNLQELWDWKNRKSKLKILNGKIFFHFNSKLCPSKIQELKKYADTADWDDRDVSPSSNGDRVACDVTNMNVTVQSLTPSVVRVKWESFHKQLYDERSLLGYVIYYREALYRNISIFEGRDACGTDAWTVRDVEVVEDSNNFIVHHITNLKPFTQYALYIRTYTTASGRQGAQSSIVYFKTQSDTPTPPVNAKARSTLPGEIVISWKQPKHPNGNVTYYIIEGIYEEDNPYFVNQRNYCLEPIAFPEYKKNIYDEDTKHVGFFDNVTSSSLDSSEEGECCPCTKDHRTLGGADDEAEFQIIFEDFLHNKVYIKNPDISRRRRHIAAQTSKEETTVKTTSDGFSVDPSAEPTEGDRYVNGSILQFKRLVYHHTFLVVSNLKHFTEYTVEIRACQDSRPNMRTDPCSTKAITSVRTLYLAGADDIRSSSLQVLAENATSYSAFVKWEEPKDSNGLIIAYTLEYRRINGENYKPKRVCVTRASYLPQNGYYLSELPPGNYSLRIRATSMAGHGNWTQHVYFHIIAASRNFTTETLLAVGVVALIIIAIGSIYAVYKSKVSTRIPNYVDYASVNPEYMSSNLVYTADEWEIEREKVQLLEELGQGSFGMVYKGKIIDLNGKPLTPCAAKTVNESASLRERIEFLQEASVMKAFNCHHVIKLLGVVSKGQPTLVIMELMTNGDLKTYLRSLRPDSEDNRGRSPPTLKQVLQMAAEIADGMAYLSAKKFVHRDLAARNCMVAEDLTVKIGDFGMTRDIYETDYYRKGGRGLLPVRWMSPESLKDGIFNSRTDVWSYGVVLWEMATLASQPYQGLSNDDVLNFVVRGGLMEKPENCPEELDNLMKMCWEKSPKSRPTFVEIVQMLSAHVNEKFCTESYCFSERHLSNSVDVEEVATPNTPLRSSICEEDTNEEQIYHYFPSATLLPENNANGDGLVNVDIEQLPTTSDSLIGASSAVETDSVAVGMNSNEGSKAISVSYSDESKGSKISTLSNGSIANGHVVYACNKKSN